MLYSYEGATETKEWLGKWGGLAGSHFSLMQSALKITTKIGLTGDGGNRVTPQKNHNVGKTMS